MLCCSYLVNGGGGGGCSCMLFLYPVPTSVDVGPDLRTLHPGLTPCACDVPTGAKIPLAQVVFVTSCNLHWWCFFHSATSTDSPLAHMVVSPSATCTGGAFSSSHHCKNCTCSSTCTCGGGGGGIYCVAINVCEALNFSVCGFGSNP